MPTRAEYLQTRLNAIARELAETDWGPDVSDQGRTIQLLAYRKSLVEEMKTVREELVKANGPFTVLG
jgi:hypothetical protein